MELLYSIVITAASSLLGLVFGSSAPPSTPIATPTPLATDQIVATYEETDYRLHWYQINNLNSIELVYNLDKKHSALEAYQINNCDFLINGGFYSKEDDPIGWFHTQTSTISASQRNFLFNGYLYITETNEFLISSTVPNHPVRLGLQTGPILIQNSRIQELNLNQDRPARRSLVAITHTNQVIFGMMTTADSTHNGPYLRDLPQLLTLFGQQLNLNFVSAINLDGGGASAYISPQSRLSEIKPIGSFFCVKNDSQQQ